MFLRKIGSAWEVTTPAKLNLYLEILNRQDSGYHELETLMVPIRLVDDLHWTPEPSYSGSAFSTRLRNSTSPNREPVTKMGLRVFHDCRWQSAPRMRKSEFGPGKIGPGIADFRVPADKNNLVESNLVVRAARLLAKRAGIEPYGTFTLYKRIPTRAGLGGGSSDAAATLVLANCAWKLGYSQAQLLEIAAELGSDVPFFIATGPTRGAAICRGRGERVNTIGSLGRLHFVLVKPPVGLSTKEIFNQVDLEASRRQPWSPATLQSLIRALRLGALTEACHWISNRLETIAMANCSGLRRLRNAFKQTACCGQWMTGSGSAYVGLVRTARQARHIAGMLRARQVGTVFTTTSC